MIKRRRSSLPLQRFDRTGLLAVDPKAFFELFVAPESRDTQRIKNVDVIEVNGPLVQRDEMWCDSYESLRARFTASCEGDAQSIIMRFDSPGGDASGCFETARALRAEAIAANKPLYAYIDKSCSAAYALATAATHGIVIGETCPAGSIGVLASRTDFTAMNTARGVRMAFIASGQRKLDGNPDHPLSEDELAEAKRHVDELAGKFFALIGDMRPQLSAAAVAAFDGAIFYGDTAVEVGLADAVSTFEELLAVASEKGDAMTILQAKSASSDYDTARTALQKAAKGDDANAEAARRALAAMGVGDDDEEAVEPEIKKEPTDPSSKDEDDDEPKTEDSDDDPKAEDGNDDEPKAEGGDHPKASDDAPADRKPKASSAPSAYQLAARVQTLEARLAAEKDSRIRRGLLAKRPDFGAEVRAVLAKAPITLVREAVASWPKVKAEAATPKPKPKPIAPGAKAITTVGATRAITQTGDGLSKAPTRASGEDADVLDRAMGLTQSRMGCKREGSTLYFGFVADPESPDGVA